MYSPAILDAKPLRRYVLRDHTALLLTDIASRGRIQYRHIVVVWNDTERDPCLYVTSEVSTSTLGESFFCTFDKDGHHNFGSSEEWNALEQFEQRALLVLVEAYGPLALSATN
jgi:hypothetical protein